MWRRNRKRTVRTMLGAAVTSMVLVIATACGSATTAPAKAPVPGPVSPQELSTVVLKVGDQKGGAKSLLAAAGLLDNVPYKIEWSTFTSGPPLLEAVSAGAIDIGQVGNTPPLFAAASNANLSVVAASKAATISDAILVPDDSPLRSVQDLRGMTIALAKGSSAHGQILNTLSAARLGLNDVKLTFMQPADAYSAFTQKRVDAWAIWDPYTAQAELDSHARVLTSGERTANGYNFTAANRKSLTDAGKNAAIGDFVTRLSKAMRYNDAHPDQRAKAWTAETGLPLDVTQRAAERKHQLPVAMDQTLVDSEQQLADAFANAGVLPGRFRFADYVDNRYDRSVVTAQ